MEIKQIPLSELLHNLAGNQAAHPEYDGAVVRSMARMLIVSYLGAGAFRSFLKDTEVREDLPYQEAAGVIADRMSTGQKTPGGVSWAVGILVRPVVQIQRAYDEHNTALLPHCLPEKAVSRREHLASRLEHAKTIVGPPHNCDRLPRL